MHNDIEVELRGRISTEQYHKLLNVLKAEGEFKQTKNRVLLDYSTFLPGEGVKERTRDIRLRVTNGQPEIVTKLGGWGGDEHREEISVMCEKGSFDRLVQTYAALGYVKAVLAVRNSEVFDYKGFEFALVEVPDHSYYFEIEAIAKNENDVAEVKQNMRDLCATLDLKLFDDKGFYAYIEELNQEANDVFEYKNYIPNFFKDTYNL